jgi:glutaredoxin
MKVMKQQCFLWNVWLTWVGLPLLAVAMGVVSGWWAAVIVLIAGVLAQVIYVKVFPKISRLLGYGSVEDQPAKPAPPTKEVSRVTLYTASVCPFCPIVKQRLLDLQRDFRFDLTEIDITFQPGLITKKGFKSVPILELDGRYLVGNATSAELAEFLSRPG